MNFLGQVTIPNSVSGKGDVLVVRLSFYVVDRLLNLGFCCYCFSGLALVLRYANLEMPQVVNQLVTSD